MALADDIRLLRDRALSELNAVHDYYIDTKIAWDIVDQFIAAGNTFSIQHAATGTITTQNDLANKAQGYVAQHLAEATFQQFVSIFENYFFDLLRLWLAAYPQSLREKTLRFEAVIEAPDKEAIIRFVVEKELNEILYKRPAEWFSFLKGRVNLDCPTEDEIDRLVEAKASRDVLVHNRGVATKTYESKAGMLARCKSGERIEIGEKYHRVTWNLICKVVADISDAVAMKAT
ncbi:MAG: hypothetical protein L0215_05830 [Gemmataceae bacterium]|nr:hypothetical protein [Gemmataceae bacterium]